LPDRQNRYRGRIRYSVTRALNSGAKPTMPPFEVLSAPAALLAELIAHARECAPHECCGLLAGRVESGTARAEVRFAVTNDAASATTYATNPRDMLRAFRAIRERGLELLAIYHSHPASPPVPSARDLAENTYGETAVHLIIGLAGAEPDVRAWWLSPDGAREAELVTRE
jgi:[CysO sulfur-carrier protein]-S-L-cysteine hydrolase